MKFVISNPYTSSLLRGKHVARHLGVKCLEGELGDAKDETVVFVKEAPRKLVEQAKERGCRIAYDVIDYYCKKNRYLACEELIDVVLVPNTTSIDYYKHRFKNAEFKVIPHQWDYRIQGEAPQDFFRPAYIGRNFNKPSWVGPSIEKEEDFLKSVPMYNCHLAMNQRRPEMIMLKPATKISTASAVGACVVAHKDPGAVELLGWDYPFYVHNGMTPTEAVLYAQKCFGGGFWKDAREKMAIVREKTSLKAVANLYRDL